MFGSAEAGHAGVVATGVPTATGMVLLYLPFGMSALVVRGPFPLWSGGRLLPLLGPAPHRSCIRRLGSLLSIPLARWAQLHRPFGVARDAARQGLRSIASAYTGRLSVSP